MNLFLCPRKSDKIVHFVPAFHFYPSFRTGEKPQSAPVRMAQATTQLNLTVRSRYENKMREADGKKIIMNERESESPEMNDGRLKNVCYKSIRQS